MLCFSPSTQSLHVPKALRTDQLFHLLWGERWKDGIGDREVQTAATRHCDFTGKAPTLRNLDHHLALHARPCAFQQSHEDSKLLCNSQSLSVEASITTFVEFIIFQTPTQQQAKLSATDLRFVKTHDTAFCGQRQEMLGTLVAQLSQLPNDHIPDGQGGIGTMLRQKPPRWGPATAASSLAATPDTPDTAASGIAAWSQPNNATSTVGRCSCGRLSTYLSIILTMVGLVSASLPVSHPIPKTLMIGTSAMACLSTGLTALQLDAPNDPRVAKTALRITSSAFLAALFVGYTLWFLRGARHKKRAFVYSVGTCSFLLWLFIRPSLAPSSSAAGEHDTFLWLDTVNLFGLVAVLIGILNAETGLFASLSPQGRTSNDDEDLIALRGPDDEENRTLVSAPGGVNAARGPSGADNGGLGSFIVALLTNSGFPAFGAHF